MLEGIAAWVLKTYVGKYVNVNAEKLSVGLLSGVVELENVPLKPDAFNENTLPFELKFGYVGKIKINISLNSLRYSPLLLTAENLLIIVGPKSTVPNFQSTDTDLDKLLKEKQEKLTNLENSWFKEVEFLGGAANETNSALYSMFVPMAYSLLKNLHVNLNKIHFRYEDELNNFSFGVNIDSISIENDAESEQKENKNLSFKKCDLNQFSIYTDNQLRFKNDNKIETTFELLNFDKINKEIKYLVKPTSLKCQIIRDTSLHPLRKRNKPRIKVVSLLDEFFVQIDDYQLSYLSKLFHTINIYYNKLKQSKVKRPENEKLNAKQLWTYAFKCVQLHIKRKTMNDFKKVNFFSSLKKSLKSIYLLYQT